jgi:hypothetical protein
MSNWRLLDRAVTPSLMDKALRISRMGKPHAEARRLLEIALRDDIDSKDTRKKTGSILAGSWLAPTEEAESLVAWGRDHAGGDLRIWHLGVLLANYRFFADVCSAIGRSAGLGREVDTTDLRSALKASWGDKENVNVATRSSVRTLRAFGVLGGVRGESASEVEGRITVPGDQLLWLVHALLVARDNREADLREALGAPELFMFDMSSTVENGYPNVERFTEGSGRVVVGAIQRYERRPRIAKQTALELELPRELELEVAEPDDHASR